MESWAEMTDQDPVVKHSDSDIDIYDDFDDDFDDYDVDDELSACERCCLPRSYFHHVSEGLSWKPERMSCPNCRSVITTRLHRTTTKRTWAIAAVLLLVGCCWLPFYRGWYCMLRHYCPVCQTLIGFAPRTRASFRQGS